MPETRALHQLKATRQTPRKPRARYREQIARSVCSPTLRRAWPRDGPEAAICVQDIDVQCVLQFTLIHAASCALHRRTSRVIHRSKLSSISCYLRGEIALKARFKKRNEKLGVTKSEDVFRAAALEVWRLFKPSEKSFRKP
jgi:hypothetical protein